MEVLHKNGVRGALGDGLQEGLSVTERLLGASALRQVPHDGQI